MRAVVYAHALLIYGGAERSNPYPTENGTRLFCLIILDVHAVWANMEEETDWFADETDGFEFCSDGRDTADVGEWDDSTAALTPTPSATSTAVTTSTPANSEKAVSGVPTHDA